MDPTQTNFGLHDPFADAEAQLSTATGCKVHLRCQQRNGRKCLTTVQGLVLPMSYLKRFLKTIKKQCNCNGSVQTEEETNTKVLQFSGDQRQNVQALLLERKMVEKADIVLHGA